MKGMSWVNRLTGSNYLNENSLSGVCRWWLHAVSEGYTERSQSLAESIFSNVLMGLRSCVFFSAFSVDSLLKALVECTQAK